MPPAPDALDLLQPEDPVGEECGVFGVWAPDEDVAKLTYYGLYALQHRGQEAAGMAVSDGSNVLVFKDLGLVAQVFDERSLSSMSGHLAIGHTRYSTTGSGTWENAQPSFRTLETGGSLALGHNGNLTNTSELSATAAQARFQAVRPSGFTNPRMPTPVRTKTIPGRLSLNSARLRRSSLWLIRFSIEVGMWPA